MKFDVVKRHERGEHLIDIGHVFGLPSSPLTVRAIVTKAAKIKLSAESVTPGSVVRIMKSN